MQEASATAEAGAGLWLVSAPEPSPGHLYRGGRIAPPLLAYPLRASDAVYVAIACPEPSFCSECGQLHDASVQNTLSTSNMLNPVW